MSSREYRRFHTAWEHNTYLIILLCLCLSLPIPGGQGVCVWGQLSGGRLHGSRRWWWCESHGNHGSWIDLHPVPWAVIGWLPCVLIWSLSCGWLMVLYRASWLAYFPVLCVLSGCQSSIVHSDQPTSLSSASLDDSSVPCDRSGWTCHPRTRCASCRRVCGCWRGSRWPSSTSLYQSLRTPIPLTSSTTSRGSEHKHYLP